MADKPQKGSL